MNRYRPHGFYTARERDEITGVLGVPPGGVAEDPGGWSLEEALRFSR